MAKTTDNVESYRGTNIGNRETDKSFPLVEVKV